MSHAILTMKIAPPEPDGSTLALLDFEFPGGGGTASPPYPEATPIVYRTVGVLAFGRGPMLVLPLLAFDSSAGTDDAGLLVRVATVDVEDACRLLDRLRSLGWGLEDAAEAALARWAAGEDAVMGDFAGMAMGEVRHG